MNTVRIELPTMTTNYVRSSFVGAWHIAVGNGRKPSGRTVCGIKRIDIWADTAVSPRANLCPECAK